MAVWEGRGAVMEEGGSFKIWGRMGGAGPQNCEGEFMGVVCGEVFVWDWRILAKFVSLLLGWEIE